MKERREAAGLIKKRKVWVSSLYLKRDEYSFNQAVPKDLIRNQIGCRDLLLICLLSFENY